MWYNKPAATLYVIYYVGSTLQQYCLNDSNITCCYILEPPSGNDSL